MIELAKLSFAYGERPILDQLDLRVSRAELVGVLGPNGAGKSTLVHLALGLLTPSTGQARIDGDDLATLSRRDIARRVAAMVQEEQPGFPISVKECVLLGRVSHLPAHGFETEADLAAAHAAMIDTRTLALADRTLHTLSGGERRRVLLARTLAQGATSIVLDEPAANLDLAHQLELFGLLRARANAGAAVLVTVHDLNLARFCDRVLLVERAGVATTGTPSEVLTQARIRSAFDVDVHVGRTDDGTPYFVPLTSHRR